MVTLGKLKHFVHSINIDAARTKAALTLRWHALRQTKAERKHTQRHAAGAVFSLLMRFRLVFQAQRPAQAPNFVSLQRILTGPLQCMACENKKQH